MKLTLENYENYIPINDQLLCKSLLEDLIELNNNLKLHKNIYIDYQIEHDEYSPERTDPCPDYYGYYTLRVESEVIGLVMDIHELDNVLCILTDFVIKINI